MELIILGVIIIVLGLFCMALSVTKFDRGCSAGMLICGVAICLIGLAARKGISEARRMESQKPIEYPATEYELKLRIVEFDGQKDTTYILTKKNELCIDTDI